MGLHMHVGASVGSKDLLSHTCAKSGFLIGSEQVSFFKLTCPTPNYSPAIKLLTLSSAWLFLGLTKLSYIPLYWKAFGKKHIANVLYIYSTFI
jgi:hypothetical protein